MAKSSLISMVLVLGFYSLLAVLLTCPLAFHLSDMVPGSYDVWAHLWNLWWVKKSILELHSSPFFTGFLFHPNGADLGLHEMSLANGILALPFSSIVFAYNILCLTSFALAGFGMYLLARYVIKDSKAAFISGFIYAFAPYHFFEVSLGHLNMMSIQWMPFYALFLIKTVKEKKLISPVLAAIFLLLISLSTWQYALYILLFTLLYLAYLYLNERAVVVDSIKRLSLLLLSYLFLASPALFPAIASVLNHERIPMSSLQTAMYYSNDAVSVFLPNGLHPLYGDYMRGLLQNTASGWSNYPVSSIGFSVLFLIACHLAAGMPKKEWFSEKIRSALANRRMVIVIITFTVFDALFSYTAFGLDFIAWIGFNTALFATILLYYLVKEKKISFWLLSAIVFWTLSMGPLLQFFGRFCFVLPYILLLPLPIRAFYRASAFMNLSVAILAGFGFSELSNRFKSRLPSFIILIQLFFEFLSAPILLSVTNVPDFYNDLAAVKGDFAVLDVPTPPMFIETDRGFIIADMPKYLYYQTIHEKKTIGGITSGMYYEEVNLLDSNPLLHELRHPEESSVLNQSLMQKANEILDYYNVRYVILHKKDLDEWDKAKHGTEDKIEQTLGLSFSENDTAFEDDEIRVFRVRQENISIEDSN